MNLIRTLMSPTGLMTWFDLWVTWLHSILEVNIQQNISCITSAGNQFNQTLNSKQKCWYGNILRYFCWDLEKGLVSGRVFKMIRLARPLIGQIAQCRDLIGWASHLASIKLKTAWKVFKMLRVPSCRGFTFFVTLIGATKLCKIRPKNSHL